MYVLGIETTGAFASTAIVKDGEVLSHIKGHDRFSHLQNLMPQVQEAVKECGLTPADMDLIAVSRGPGSFTGIRIGVSSARALSQMLGTPCAAVSSLEALAMRAGGIGGGKALICPMLDARRSQIYGGGYVLEDGYPVEVIKGAPYMLEEFLEKTSPYDEIIILGDACDAYGEKIGNIRSEGVILPGEDLRYQEAPEVARLGARIFSEKGGLGYLEVQPDYMRIAEAERKLREKQGKGAANG